MEVWLILLGVALIDAKIWKMLLEQRRHNKTFESLLAEIRDRYSGPDRSMDEQKNTRLSNFLSYMLRSRPDEIGIERDAQGSVAIDALLDMAATHGNRITREELNDVVKNNKQRFSISEDGARNVASGRSSCRDRYS